MSEILGYALLGLAMGAIATALTLAVGRWIGRWAAVAIPLLGIVAAVALIANGELRYGGYSRLDWYAYAIFLAVPTVLGGGIGLSFRPWRKRVV
jgi:hypothetical protein